MFVGSSSGLSSTYRYRSRSAPIRNFPLAQPNESGMQIIAVSGPMATAALRSALPQTRSVFPDICRSGTQCPKPPDTQQYGVKVRVPVMSSVASFAHTTRDGGTEGGCEMGRLPAASRRHIRGDPLSERRLRFPNCSGCFRPHGSRSHLACGAHRASPFGRRSRSAGQTPSADLALGQRSVRPSRATAHNRVGHTVGALPSKLLGPEHGRRLCHDTEFKHHEVDCWQRRVGFFATIIQRSCESLKSVGSSYFRHGREEPAPRSGTQAFSTWSF